MSVQAAGQVAVRASQISERSARVNLLDKASNALSLTGWALCHPLEAWDTTRSRATSPVASYLAPRICKLSLLQSQADAISMKAATLSYDATHAQVAMNFLGQAATSGLSALSSYFWGPEAGRSVANTLSSFGAQARKASRAAAIRLLSDTAFLPIINLLQEAAVKQITQSLLNKGVDSAILYSVGTTGVIGKLCTGDLAQLTKVGTLAERVANVAKLAAVGYTYAPVALSASQLALSCCHVRKLQTKIHAMLDEVDLQALLNQCGLSVQASAIQSTLATTLALCLENSSLLSQIDLAKLFQDASMMQRMLSCVSSAKTE